MDSRVEEDLSPVQASLKNMDTLLRCPICFDFLNISMMTKCSHNFCSLCIRKFLSYKLQCPVCNTEATDQDLRNNRILDELVVSFQTARQQLSKVNSDSPPISPKTPAVTFKCKTPRVKGQKGTSANLSNFFQKRPKTSEAQHTHCANEADLHSALASTQVAVKEEPMDVQFQGLMSVKDKKAVSHSSSTGVEMAHSSSASHDVKPVIKVECPVCSVSVSKQFINKHLDSCLSSGEKRDSLRSSFAKGRRPMSKPVYNLLSIVELKRRLKDCHLSVKGTRDQMIKKHREFVYIYNAQCDSLNPRSAEDIAKEVEASEKIKNQLQTKAKPVMIFSKNQTEKEIDEMHSNYRKQHSSDFSCLIAQVRGRLATTRQRRIKQEVIEKGEDEGKTQSTDQAAESKSEVVVKAEDIGDVDEQSAKGTKLPPSPANSDVSVSSSISDIFGPEPPRNQEETESSSVLKRMSSSRGEASTSSPIRGKRRRKT